MLKRLFRTDIQDQLSFVHVKRGGLRGDGSVVVQSIITVVLILDDPIIIPNAKADQ
jgi:hypothetical protein